MKTTDTKKPTCSLCDAPLGDDAKTLPVFADDVAVCPPCFVGKSIVRDPGRWGGAYSAVRCQFCKFVTLAVGVMTGVGIGYSCSRCGKPAALPVAAKE